MIYDTNIGIQHHQTLRLRHSQFCLLRGVLSWFHDIVSVFLVFHTIHPIIYGYKLSYYCHIRLTVSVFLVLELSYWYTLRSCHMFMLSLELVYALSLPISLLSLLQLVIGVVFSVVISSYRCWIYRPGLTMNVIADKPRTQRGLAQDTCQELLPWGINICLVFCVIPFWSLVATVSNQLLSQLSVRGKSVMSLLCLFNHRYHEHNILFRSW